MRFLLHPARVAGTPAWLRGTAASIVASGFLAAIALELLALMLVDMQELRWAAQAKGWPLAAVHAAAFLVLWGLGSAASLVGYLGWLVVGAWKVRTRLR